MTEASDPAEVYRALGVRPAINVSGTTTGYGGTKLRREVMEAMNSAASVLVDVHELNARAGEIIAEIVGRRRHSYRAAPRAGWSCRRRLLWQGTNPPGWRSFRTRRG